MSFDQSVARHIFGARQLHAPGSDKAAQQLIECLHHLRIAMQLIRTQPLNSRQAVFFDIARDDA